MLALLQAPPNRSFFRGGCTIYETRPTECRDVYRAWLTSPALGPEWRVRTSARFLCGMKATSLQSTSIQVIQPPGAVKRAPQHEAAVLARVTSQFTYSVELGTSC